MSEAARGMHEPAVRAVADFDAFFRREFRPVVALAYALSGSRLAAEDLAQEAFVEAQRRWAEIGAYDKPGAWVRRVVSNRAVSFLRRRGAELRAISRLQPLATMVHVMPEYSADVWKAVRRLPDRQAQVVALTYLEGMTFAEIAELLEIGPETARTHLSRAHVALQRHLDARAIDEPRHQ